MNTIAVSQDFQTIPISLLRESPENPRHAFDKTALNELAASIKTEGVHVPLIVRPVEEGGSYELIAGHRRLRAAHIAGTAELPCVIRNLTDDEARAARLIENLLRENLQPLEEAEAYRNMLGAAASANRPLTPSDLAAKIGKQESHVRLRLKLLTADSAVKDALRKQQITEGHALELSRLDRSLQKDLLKFCLYTQWGQRREFVVSIAELRKHIAQSVMLDLTHAPFKVGDDKLLPEAGACIDCKRRTGNDRLLFADVRQGDICTLPSCYRAKVARSIDVTLEQLKAANLPAARISTAYNRNGQTTQDILTTAQYEVISKGTTCGDTKVGVYVDGPQQGKKASICTNSRCAVHHSAAMDNSSGPARKAQRAKARKEAAARTRIFAAIHSAASEVKRGDTDFILLAEYALQRADHNGLMKLAKVLDWPKDLFGWEGRKRLRSKLEESGVEVAVAVALLASVSSELSVSEFHSGKPERLETLAKSFNVDATAIRKQVDVEFAAKGKKASPSGHRAASAPKRAKAKQNSTKRSVKKKQP